MAYVGRLADAELDGALEWAGAMLIEGPRACGKTATASRRATSIVRIDTDPAVAAQIAVDPALVLEGDRPRPPDEWQVHPRLWNAVRWSVDDSGERGQFILTGSTAPGADSVRHSGAGRFARSRMRTMSPFESGESDASVSLSAPLDGIPPRSVAVSALGP